MRKRLEIVIKLALIGLFLLGVISLSRIIVRASYSSLAVLNSKNAEKSDSDSTEYKDILEKVFTSADEYSTVSLLYNPNNLAERRNVFLENNYPELLESDILSRVEDSAKEAFESVFARDDSNMSEVYTVESDTGELSSSLLEEKGSVLVRQDLCIVDFFDNTSVVYEYISDPSVIVCVDYSHTLFSQESSGIINLGDTGSVYLTTGSYTVENLDNYTVIYAKG